jgi:hypothetical protein
MIRLSKMKKECEEKNAEMWDCFSFPCSDSCCQHGVDVLARERDLLISDGKATASDFLSPETDKTGATTYRTRKGPRGCVFLMDERGCKLHSSGHKPSVCCAWPRTFHEAKSAANDDYLPCFHLRYNLETKKKIKTY